MPHNDDRHNFLVLTADGLLFFLGMIFISFETVLPVFLARLGAPRVVIGLIPVAVVMGVNLPSIVAAGLVERQPLKRPYLVRRALWQRIPWGFVAIAIPFLAPTRPDLLIVAILLAVLVATAAGGFVIPAFFHIVSVTVPVEKRGTLFALRSVMSYLFGIGGGVLVQVILSRIAFPGNYSLLYGIATIILFVGLVVFATVREPPGEAVDRPLPLKKRIRRVLASSRSYRAYLVARGFLILAFATTSFFPVYIVERFGLPDSISGVFAMITAGTFILVNPIFGRLGNRVGYRPVFLTAFVSLAIAGIVGLLRPGQYLAYSLIAFTAVGQSVNLLAWNMTVEFAPEGEVPSYVGVTGLFVGLIGPLSVVTGLLVDWVGFGGIFVMALVCGICGFLVMILGVEEPRVMQRRLNQPDMPI
ncbi:MAG: MFS transporter [Spirochaetales bacterium]